MTPDSPAIHNSDGTSAFRWWERMRWIYNLAVGLVGVSMLAFNAHRFSARDLVDLVGYGMAANFAYTLGMWVELADLSWNSGKFGISRFRLTLFLIGTLASMALTAFLILEFYHFRPHRF